MKIKIMVVGLVVLFLCVIVIVAHAGPEDVIMRAQDQLGIKAELLKGGGLKCMARKAGNNSELKGKVVRVSHESSDNLDTRTKGGVVACYARIQRSDCTPKLLFIGGKNGDSMCATLAAEMTACTKNVVLVTYNDNSKVLWLDAGYETEEY